MDNRITAISDGGQDLEVVNIAHTGQAPQQNGDGRNLAMPFHNRLNDHSAVSATSRT